MNKIQSSPDSVNGETSKEMVKVLESGEEHTTAAERAAPLSLDVVFDLLKNQRRRRVLQYLQGKGEATISDLAEHVAALENQKEVAQLSSSERKRVYVGLYQCHLPRMDDADVIEFNADRGVVKLTEQAAQLEKYLDVTRRRWPLYYAAIAFGGAAVYVLSWLALGMTILSSIILVSILVTISVCAFFHHRSDARRSYL